jgi:hypothetical protein
MSLKNLVTSNESEDINNNNLDLGDKQISSQ